tara:strand:- start:173 stop:616 length:444 start_codon:yes stop_codon:yes gene_type:complete
MKESGEDPWKTQPWQEQEKAEKGPDARRKLHKKMGKEKGYGQDEGKGTCNVKGGIPESLVKLRVSQNVAIIGQAHVFSHGSGCLFTGFFGDRFPGDVQPINRACGRKTYSLPGRTVRKRTCPTVIGHVLGILQGKVYAKSQRNRPKK